VILEAGAFGFSADWASVQARLASKGVRSIAYDRAGLGRSDPGPSPRDGVAIEQDLTRLLAAAHEPGPYVLVGHSMAGLHVRLFAARHRDRVKGLVLVDAATPEASQDGRFRGFVEAFGAVSTLAGIGASAGLLKPFAFAGDAIGLTGAAAEEKRWAFAHGPHNRAAAAEAGEWTRIADQARAAGPLDPTLPLAVVVAGHMPDGWTGMQSQGASGGGPVYHRVVAAAGHANLLGEAFADEVVAAIEHVLERVAAEAPG